MNRFRKSSQKAALVSKLLPILIFVCILVIFMTGLSSVSHITGEKEEEGLKNSIMQSAVHCYALEGFYPDSLSYLEEHYGIQYDKEKYLISYEIIGSNLMPDISVIPLNKKTGGTAP